MKKLIAYASDFVSFFIENIKELNKINSIILFGSVARDEAKKESDVDLFVDVSSREKEIGKESKKIKERFLDSVKYKKYWKLMNVDNEINIIVGKIDKWKLKDSLSEEAIVLYGKYSGKLSEGKNVVIFSWENVKPNSKRVLFNKKIFGYKHRDKFYQGVLDIYQGKKLSKGSIMFDAKYLNEVLKIFRKFKVKVKINKVSQM